MQKREPRPSRQFSFYVFSLICFGLVNLPLGYAQSGAECAMWREFGFCILFGHRNQILTDFQQGN